MKDQTFVFSEELLAKDKELRTIDKNTDEYSGYALRQMGFELNLSLHYKQTERDYQMWSHPTGMLVFLLLSEPNSALPGKKRIDDFRFVMFGEKELGEGWVILKTEKFGDNIMADESSAPHCVNLYTVKDQGCSVNHNEVLKFPSFVGFLRRNKEVFESIKNRGIPNDLLSLHVSEWFPEFLHKKAALKLSSESKPLELELRKAFQPKKDHSNNYLIPGDLEWKNGNAKRLIDKMMVGAGRTEITMADREEIENFFKDLRFAHTYDELKPFMNGKTAGIDNGLFVFMVLLQSPAARSTIWRSFCESVSPEEYLRIMNQPCVEPGSSWSLYFLDQTSEIKNLNTAEFKEYTAMLKRCFSPDLKFEDEILNVSGVVLKAMSEDVKTVPGPHASTSFAITENLSKNEVFLDLLLFLEEEKVFDFYAPIKCKHVAHHLDQFKQQILAELAIQKVERPQHSVTDQNANKSDKEVSLMGPQMIESYAQIIQLFGKHGAPVMYDFMERKQLRNLLLKNVKQLKEPELKKNASVANTVSRF